jgi:peroxiredoxin
MTGVPGASLPEGWLELPGAYGCSAQACAYRDLRDELASLDAAVYGVSTQTSAEQAEFAARERISFPLLSDAELRLTSSLRLPRLEHVSDPARIKRATMIVDRARRLRHVSYPIPDPAADAVDALRLVLEMTRRDASSA